MKEFKLTRKKQRKEGIREKIRETIKKSESTRQIDKYKWMEKYEIQKGKTKIKINMLFFKINKWRSDS